MRTVITIVIILGVVATPVARAQVEPEATSPGKIGVSGTLTYSARYTQIAEYYGGGSGQMANLSGNFGYSTTSERHRTSITLGAGDSWGITGIGYSSGPYESLVISQSANGRHLLLSLHDELAYHSGVGIGEPNPTSQSSAAAPILTLNTAILNNNATVQLNDLISGSTTLSASATYNQLDYPNGNGVSTIGSSTYEAGGSVELSHRLEGRNTFFAEDAFSDYIYPDSAISLAIHANMTVAGWSRIWTRRISTTASAGPQWIAFQADLPPSTTCAFGCQTQPQLPSSTGYSARASVRDTLRFGTAGLAFSHGINGGGGYFYGAEMNDLSGTFTREFGRHEGSRVTLDLVGGYRRTDSLSGTSSISTLGGLQGDFDSEYGYAQATRQLGRHFSAYAGYTATEQSLSSATTAGLLNGVWQTFSFGLGFTPPPIHLRQ